VTTVSTPLEVHASWWSTWVCQLKLDPALISNIATVIADGDPASVSEHCPSGDTSWQRTR